MNSKLIIAVVIVMLIFSLVITCCVGLKAASEIFQSFGVGFGALLAGLGGLTVFWDWWQKKQEENERLKKYKEKYPRKLLNKDFELIRSDSNHDPVYILDLKTKIKHWIKDQKTRKELGFRPDDVKEIDDTTFKLYDEGNEIG